MNPKPGNRQAEEQTHNQGEAFDGEHLMIDHSIKFPTFVLLFIYPLFSSAKDILKRKGLNLFTFSLFTTVSTFSNCDFVPTNENMLVFAKNSGLLLVLIPQVLQGNSLFPACLRFSIWVLGKVVRKVEYSNYLLKNTRAIGYHHLLPNRRSCYLVFTVFGFIAAQLIFFCAMEWNSEALIGLDPYEKIIGLFFQSVNTRHTGETIVDLSTISAAILVILIVMMSVSLSLSLSL
ncbi:Cation transporter - like 2 [Theobroma cacao]|nr:Cation transporter - like 2 [Theobroma cacao]